MFKLSMIFEGNSGDFHVGSAVLNTQQAQLLVLTREAQRPQQQNYWFRVSYLCQMIIEGGPLSITGQ